MQDPKSTEMSVNKELILADYLKIFEIIKRDDFYTHPHPDQAEQIKSYFRKVQAYLRAKGNQMKYQFAASTFEPMYAFIDAIQKQDYDGFVVKMLRSSWCDMNPGQNGFLDNHPRVFCQFYLMGQIVFIPELIEKGTPGVNQIPEMFESRKKEIFTDGENPLEFVQSAFSAKYNEHVKWGASMEVTYTAKVFTNERDADVCIEKLKAIGIEECSKRTVGKAFRVEIPNWRVLQAMDKFKQRQVDQQRENNSPKFGRP